jgi:hypothetical protein
MKYLDFNISSLLSNFLSTIKETRMTLRKSVDRRQKGEIIELTEEPKKVNRLRGTELDITLYVVNGRLYKRLKDGKYRSLVLQTKRPEYNHYFLRDKDKKKLTVNVHKLDLLTWSDGDTKIELKEENANAIEDSRTE